MRAKNFEGSKYVKMKLSKSDEVVKTFDDIRTVYTQIPDIHFSVRKA